MDLIKANDARGLTGEATVIQELNDMIVATADYAKSYFNISETDPLYPFITKVIQHKLKEAGYEVKEINKEHNHDQSYISISWREPDLINR